jgi:hypothetical protein
VPSIEGCRLPLNFGLLPLPVGPIHRRWPAPFAPQPLQPLRRYYGAVRPSPAHRYFRPCGWNRLSLFPWHRRLGSHVPYKSLVELRAIYMPWRELAGIVACRSRIGSYCVGQRRAPVHPDRKDPHWQAEAEAGPLSRGGPSRALPAPAPNAHQLLMRLMALRLRAGMIVSLILENSRSPKPTQTGCGLLQKASFRTRPSTCHRAWAPFLKKMVSPGP